MTRTPLLRQVHGHWAWLTAATAAAAAGLLAVRRAAPGRGQADSTEPDTKPADGTAHGAAAVGTRLRQACTAAADPEQHKAAPGTGNGSAAQTPAADELPARGR
jgi:hypothetical protein